MQAHSQGARGAAAAVRCPREQLACRRHARDSRAGRARVHETTRTRAKMPQHAEWHAKGSLAEQGGACLALSCALPPSTRALAARDCTCVCACACVQRCGQPGVALHTARAPNQAPTPLDGITQGEKRFMFVLAFTGFFFVLCVITCSRAARSLTLQSQMDEARGRARNKAAGD